MSQHIHNESGRRPMNLDDAKVFLASVAGLLNWAANIDIVLKVLISGASLIYICLKIKELLRK